MMETSTLRAERTYARFVNYEGEQDIVESGRDPWGSISGGVSFLASALTAFTVSLVGEMPVGEFLLIGAAAWAVLCLVINHALPGRLFRSGYFWALMVAQLVAFAAYIASDLYRHSAPRD